MRSLCVVPLLILLFIVVPIVELYVIIQVGAAIGVLPTIALLVADSILGSMLLRSQGRAVWRRFSDALAEHRAPTREVLDGVLVIFGGAFLLTPGFVTDVFGLVLLLPPTRAIIRRVLVRSALRGALAGRVIISTSNWAGGRSGTDATDGTQEPFGPPPYDITGTATEIDPRQLP
jgi:UPF0716 protein FxsA